jgi:cadmium resistance transport/sequestration family protein
MISRRAQSLPADFVFIFGYWINFLMFETIIIAVLAFASTNIDDIFILTLFYASKKYTSASIIAGQFLGITFLVVASLFASFAGNFVDPRFVGLLGMFPIYLSIKQAVEFLNKNENKETVLIAESNAPALFTIAGVTVANGGDNIGVYVPLFSTLEAYEKIQLLIVFGILVFIWCYIARYLSYHPLLSKSLNKYAHISMPVVLFILGIFILYESEAYTLAM